MTQPGPKERGTDDHERMIAAEAGARTASGDEQPETEPAEPLDLRLVPAAAAAWLAAVLALHAPPNAGLAAAVLLMVTAGGCGLVWQRQRQRQRQRPDADGAARRGSRLLVAAAALGCAAAATVGAAARVDALRSGPVSALAADAAVVRAELVVTADPVRSRPVARPGRPARQLLVVRARIETIQARGQQWSTRLPVLVLADDEGWLDLLPSQGIRVSGRLGAARPGQDVAAVMRVTGGPELIGRPDALQRAAGRLRSGLRDAVAGLPPPQAGLIPGLVVGDTSRLPTEVADDFRTTGLTHLTAVSGANCAIVLGFVVLLARWAGVRGHGLPALGALALLGFLLLARPQPSVLRATVMGLVAVLAMATGRRRYGVPALAAAALTLVLADPWLALSYGFVLSVLATAGLLVVAPGWTDVLARWMPRPLAAALAVPAAAQAVCAPVIVLLSSQVSLAAVPANLLVAPAVAPATILGVLTALCAPVSATAAQLLGWCAGLPAWLIVTVATTLARAPAAAIGWPGTPTGAALLAAATAGAALLGRRLVRRPQLALGLCVAGVAAAVPVVALQPSWPPAGWLLVACDVGQGDALVLSTGARQAVVVDTGPDPAPVDACLHDLRVTQVATLVLTHLHADHVEGLPGVLRHRVVSEVVVGPLDEPAGESVRVTRWLRDAGIPVRRAAVGESNRVGELTWQVLAPPGPISEGSAPNNSSLVLLAVHGGMRMLLTGDVEPEAQRALLRVLDRDADGRSDFGPVDLLKVPHHGSANQLPALFAAVRPRLALVSVGRDNDYGHPAAATLRLVHDVGATLARTDQDGDLAIVGPPDRLRLVRRGR